jgi:rhodanese-related sulfurtransferase
VQFGVPEVDAIAVAPDAVVLDVREDDEWESGHIAGSTHVPLSELMARVDEVPATDPLVVVCRIGARSAQVAAWLRGQGRDAVNLAGGLESWAAAGRPLVTDSGAPGTVG